MNTRILLIFLILLAIFFATYGLLVENPFTADKISIRSFAVAALSLAADSPEFPISRVAVGIMVLVLARVAIWLMRRALEI